MSHLEKLKSRLCRELDEMADVENLTLGDIETIHKLASSIKNINKIMSWGETKEEPSLSTYSDSEEPSEFMTKARLADNERLLHVLDSHMEMIKQLYPKEYRYVIGNL